MPLKHGLCQLAYMLDKTMPYKYVYGYIMYIYSQR